NVASHILTGLVLYGIVWRTLRSARLGELFHENARWLGFAVALLWIVHPLNTETVDYTIQRTEGLMGLFFLMTLYCVIRGDASSNRRTWYIAAVVSCFLGTASKEVIVVAPLVV